MCCGNKLLEMIQNTYVKLSKNKRTTQITVCFVFFFWYGDMKIIGRYLKMLNNIKFAGNI